MGRSRYNRTKPHAAPKAIVTSGAPNLLAHGIRLALVFHYGAR